jgi:hypothetical protein
MAPAGAARFRERTSVERAFAWLKDGRFPPKTAAPAAFRGRFVPESPPRTMQRGGTARKTPEFCKRLVC